MTEILVSAQQLIRAPAEQVYGYLADYRQHHPKILPPAFSGFQIDEGGVGAGTVFRISVTAAGRTRSYHMRVSEPEPGRTLVETDQDSSLVTTFTVIPDAQGALTRIETRWQGASGIGGFFERLFAPRAAGRMYADELRRLDEYARAKNQASGVTSQ
jgi:hypothetical protein